MKTLYQRLLIQGSETYFAEMMMRVHLLECCLMIFSLIQGIAHHVGNIKTGFHFSIDEEKFSFKEDSMVFLVVFKLQTC